jgi:GNAT superfamily N-acetyltransferase
MAWVALVPRVPRPQATSRLAADTQSVFVMPEQRGTGIGSALVEAASEHATRLGSLRVTVHSGRKAVPVYERAPPRRLTALRRRQAVGIGAISAVMGCVLKGEWWRCRRSPARAVLCQ